MDGALSGLLLADAHVRVEQDLRSIGGVVAVGEAHLQRRGRVPHEQTAAGHPGDAVRVGVGVAEQLGLALLEEAAGLGGRAAPGLVEARPELGGLVEENLPVDGPRGQRLEGVAVQPAGLLVGRQLGQPLPGLVRG